MRRVVITGIGIVCPVGNTVDDSWNALCHGVSGLGPITLFDASTMPVRIGGEVKNFDVESIKNRWPRAESLRDRKVFLGLAAAQEAIESSGCPIEEWAKVAIHVGMSLESFFLEDVAEVANEEDLTAILAARTLSSLGGPLLQSPLDTLAEFLADRLSSSIPPTTNCSACAAGGQSIGLAFRQIRAGEIDIALAGAADSMLNPLGLGGFSLLKALSDENDDPKRSCRPFDVTRTGTTLGEGASFLVLEELGRAQDRNAKIYSEIVGYGSSLDSFRVSDPDPEGNGASLAMDCALKDAKMPPQAVDAVNAHGTGTPKNDPVEIMAIKRVLGKRSFEIPIHAVKSMTGHMIAASGALEAAVSVLSLNRNLIPPTINLAKPDPACDLYIVKDFAKAFTGNTVLSNSFGFGGQNAALIFRRWIP
ncbi:beta-ketoacyl-[acyl-carrier-protein] synthase family protein [bacterium]|nr:beta-ketoacyl-[acyl-carrier-protein] synthase family protein [bacterium]